MKKIVFMFVYIGLGLLAFSVRILLEENADTTYYMCIINQFAGFVTLVMVLGNVLLEMLRKIKENKQSVRRTGRFCLFSIVTMILYWVLIKKCYANHPNNLLNDVMTICTLTIALTTEIYESLLLAIFYKG